MSQGLLGDAPFSGCDPEGSTEVAVGAYAEDLQDSEALGIVAAHAAWVAVPPHQDTFIVDEKPNEPECVSNFLAVRTDSSESWREGPARRAVQLRLLAHSGVRRARASPSPRGVPRAPLKSAVSKQVPNLKFSTGIIHTFLANVSNHDIRGKAPLMLTNEANMTQ